MKTLIYHTCHIIILCLVSLSVRAEIDYYTWVDEDGITNYSQRDPNDYTAEHITGPIKRDLSKGRPQANSSSAPPPVAQSRPVTPAAEQQIDPDALVAEQRAILASKLAETRRSNCVIGKRNLAQLSAYRRIRVSDEKGENRILTEEEKAAKTETARQVVRENCSG